MQFLTEVSQRVGEFAKENASTLLTTGGVVGTVATAVLAARSGMKYAEVLAIEKENLLAEDLDRQEAAGAETLKALPPQLDKLTKLRLAAPYFIPPIITGTTTIASIIMAHRMSSAKIAALAAAYGLAERNFGEYKEKVAEKLTGPKKAAIDEELAQDRVNKTPGHESIVIVSGEVLCFDEATGRYFNSTMEKIKQAVNTTNSEIIHFGYATATFFYHELGLPATAWSDEFGWGQEDKVDLDFSTVLAPDQRPCISFNFKSLPTQDYSSRSPKHY